MFNCSIRALYDTWTRGILLFNSSAFIKNNIKNIEDDLKDKKEIDLLF